MQTEWNQLQVTLQQQLLLQQHTPYASTMPTWQRLFTVLATAQTEADILAAYRDALATASTIGVADRNLPATKLFKLEQLKRFGLEQRPASKELSLRRPIDQGLAPIFEHQVRRKVFKVPFDPMLQRRLNAPEYQFYNGSGQATAVRAVLKAPKEATLLVNLPTGCGKTMLIDAQVATTPKDQMVLVIVPTTALALDQAARMATTLQKMGEDHGGDYAWHSGLSEQSKEGLKQRIQDGQQRVLFTSPEAAASSLTVRLFELAQSQRLAALVIDEAHILAQWGAEFRPEFQLMPPLLRALQNSSPRPIRHILMSATLTQTTIDTLRHLLPKQQQIIEINGSFLRPEIDYVIERSNSEEEHKCRVKELIDQLPRPLIIYTTTVEEAKEWFSHLQKQGHLRIGLFTGDTQPAERQRLVGEWRNNLCDIMVATSAFGVGIDKADVRSIVHAAIPENLDRYYQECGRGGRDGHASRAHLVCHPGQLSAALRISKKRLIGRQKGFARWMGMYSHRKPSDIAEYAVSVNIVPEHGSRTNGENTDWNWRTLLLMQRAGLLTIHFVQPTPRQRSPEESETDYRTYIEQYYNDYFDTVHVDLKSGHTDIDFWWQEVSRQRESEAQADEADFDTLKQSLADANVSLCKILQRHYQTPRWQPERTCGGCPNCRQRGAEPTQRQIGQSSYCSYRSSNDLMQALHYPQNTDLRALLQNLRPKLQAWIGSGQVQAIRTDADTRKALQRMFHTTDLVWIDLDFDDINEYWDELVLLPPSAKTSYQPDPFGPGTILIAPAELPDLHSPYRRWVDCHSNVMSLQQFIRQ